MWVFTKMPFYVKSTNFWKKSIKGLAKFKWDDKNGHLVQIVIIKANLGKNGEYAKINQGFGQIFKWNDKKWHVDSWRFYKNDKFSEIATLARSNEWLSKWHGENSGLLVIRDFYEDSKFGRKWQIWEEYMKGLNKIQMRSQIRLPWQLLSFRKRQIFNKNGEFDKGWSDVWQKLTNELTNWESMWKTGFHLRLNLEWSLI